MFSGRNSLIKRLAYQMGGEKSAMTVLKQRGHLDEDGNLTQEGKKRDAMTASERAKDRHTSDNYKLSYNPSTNRATLLPQFRRKAKKL